MHTAGEDQGTNLNDLTGSEAEAHTTGSRRLLLAGAAGGLALGASGLLLPDWLVKEAAADMHPVRRVQDRKQRKHDKRRNQDKQRDHGGKKDKQKDQDKPRGALSGIEFGVTDYPGGRSVRIGHWVKGDNEHEADLKEVRIIAPGADIASFDDKSDIGSLNIDGRFEIAINNVSPVGYPVVKVYDNIHNTSICCNPLAEGAKAPLLQVDGWEIEFVRFDDTWLRKHYRVLIRTPPA